MVLGRAFTFAVSLLNGIVEGNVICNSNGVRNMQYSKVLEQLMAGNDLGSVQMQGLMDGIMEGQLTPPQIAAILVALRIKGESIEEISSAAQSMRAHATPIDAGEGPILDIVGTGGDGHHTINVSTASAFVAAGAGATVAKHGNRSVSSKCGSADVLAALGVNIEASPELVGHCVREIGVGFLFAPVLHGAMKYAIGPRKELGVRTIFNILGPLTNPACATHMMIGVYRPELVDTYINVLNEMGINRAMVVHGNDGMDEISCSARTQVKELKNNEITSYEFDPRDYIGLLADKADIQGGDAAENAKALRQVLEGEKGPKRDIILLNAAAGIYVSGLADSYPLAFELAQDSIDCGKALAKLDQLVDLSNSGS